MMASFVHLTDRRVAVFSLAAGASVTLSVLHFFKTRVAVTEDIPVTFSILGRPTRVLPNGFFVVYPLLVGVEVICLSNLVNRPLTADSNAAAIAVLSGTAVTLVAQWYAARIGSRSATKMPSALSAACVVAVCLPCVLLLKR
mmetsp:Transcript_68723/g.80097  ORF Transcript_68723/g.80097 Transcript_68723/m.80097 type:complete len:142 (+) Transcript_68723:43-468(+)